MSAKAPALKMKKGGGGKSPAEPRREGRVAATGRAGSAAAAEVAGGADSPDVGAFVTLLQEILRNALPKFDAAATIEFHRVLEREIGAALEAKGVCECHPAAAGTTAGTIKDRPARTEALLEHLNEITQVSELDDIKQAATSRIRLLTRGKTYRKKIIKGREYLYEVYWDSKDKKKKYKYVGPAGNIEAGDLHINGNGKRE